MKGPSIEIGKRKWSEHFTMHRLQIREMGLVYIRQELALLRVSVNCVKLEAWNLKHFIYHHFYEFLKDIIINQFINISHFSKDNIGNTLMGYDMFQTIGTNNVQ